MPIFVTNRITLNHSVFITTNDLIKTAFELSGIKSVQDLCEQAIKELIRSEEHTSELQSL